MAARFEGMSRTRASRTVLGHTPSCRAIHFTGRLSASQTRMHVQAASVRLPLGVSNPGVSATGAGLSLNIFFFNKENKATTQDIHSNFNYCDYCDRLYPAPRTFGPSCSA